MKIYLAGNVATIERERKNKTFYRFRLLSYIYIIPGSIEFGVFEWLKSSLRECQEEEVQGIARERES
jgi:hypothetical protein